MPPASAFAFDDAYPMSDMSLVEGHAPQFLEQRAEPDYHLVQVDFVGKSRIETVRTGANEGSTERPGLFETRVEEGELVRQRFLYPTIVEAIEGHDRAVDDARRSLRTSAWRDLQRAVEPALEQPRIGA